MLRLLCIHALRDTPHRNNSDSKDGDDYNEVLIQRNKPLYKNK